MIGIVALYLKNHVAEEEHPQQREWRYIGGVAADVQSLRPLPGPNGGGRPSLERRYRIGVA